MISCRRFLEWIGLLHPYVVRDVVTAEKENVIRDNRDAVREASTATREAHSAAIVASATLRLMRDEN